MKLKPKGKIVMYLLEMFFLSLIVYFMDLFCFNGPHNICTYFAVISFIGFCYSMSVLFDNNYNNYDIFTGRPIHSDDIIEYEPNDPDFDLYERVQQNDQSL